MLGNATLLYNALSDMLGEDGKKLRNQVRMAVDAGLGKLYLEQLQTPAPDFDKRSLALLTEDAGLGESAAKQIRDLFHGMVGFSVVKEDPPKPEPPKVEPPKVEPVRPAHTASPKEHKKPNTAVIVAVVLIVAAVICGAAMYMNKIGPFAPRSTSATVPPYAPAATSVREPETPEPVSTRAGMMMEDYRIYTSGGSSAALEDLTRLTVLGSEYHRREIHSIRFANSIANKPADAWDVSIDGDGTVWAWVTSSGNSNAPYDLTIAANGAVKLGEKAKMLFGGYVNLASIDFTKCVDTSAVTDMNMMFYHCESIKALDLSSFDTTNVTQMFTMFADCYQLTTLDITSFNTASVQDMTTMFADCSSLTSVIASSQFVIGSGTKTMNMFSNCPTSFTEKFDIR